MGLDVYLYKKTDSGEVSIRNDSAVHPEHMFKIGYFRSSYNDGGINSVMDRAGLPTLYDIFSPGDEYEFTPNWQTARKLAQSVLEQWRTYQAGTAGKYDCMSVRQNMFVDPSTLCGSKKDAMDIFLKEFSNPGVCRAYSKRDGVFYMDGIKVCGFIPGKEETFIVYQKDRDGEDWHGQALEIVVETCDWVLQQETEKFLLHWSA